MKVTPLELPEVLLLQPTVHKDPRGCFFESWAADRYVELGISGPFVQDNVSVSAKNVVRGLHYQWPGNAQGKLVSVAHGRVWDVAVDVRRGSPRFGRWVAAELDDVNRHQLWIPPGFAHGFVAMTDDVVFTYKCTARYSPKDEVTIRWDDPTIAVAWPVREPLRSPRDAAAPQLSELSPERFPIFVEAA